MLGCPDGRVALPMAFLKAGLQCRVLHVNDALGRAPNGRPYGSEYGLLDVRLDVGMPHNGYVALPNAFLKAWLQ